MTKTDARVDDYIAKQQDFAKPILRYLRDVIHEACPEAEETLKWSSPAFMYHDEILCGFAGFKEHAMFGFWKHELLLGDRQTGMGSFGKLTSTDDLPPKKQLQTLIRKAMELTDKGVKTPRAPRREKKTIALPGDLKTALGKNKKAKATYDAFSPSKKFEYLEWITEAKGEDTRKRRVDQAIEWMSKGKSRNWKYV